VVLDEILRGRVEAAEAQPGEEYEGQRPAQRVVVVGQEVTF